MKYIISWDTGNGPEFDEVEAECQAVADFIAYERWIDAVSVDAVFSAEEVIEDLL